MAPVSRAAGERTGAYDCHEPQVPVRQEKAPKSLRQAHGDARLMTRLDRKAGGVPGCDPSHARPLSSVSCTAPYRSTQFDPTAAGSP